jgi:16S rRNA (guanine527-N7)-methyltransferase
MTLPPNASLNPDVLDLDLLVDATRQQQLHEYLARLLSENEKFNLTAIADPSEAWSRHVLESLRLLPLLENAGNLIDVGSGGGLPGMVLAIARPKLAVTLLEATGKKARFLEQTVRGLGLPNVNVVSERAETAAQVGSRLRERFDLVTARAVAPLRVLLELTVPFAKVQGTLMAIKGEQAAAELDQAAAALSALDVVHEQSLRHETATILLFRKLSVTPAKYPRRSGEPKRSPL